MSTSDIHKMTDYLTSAPSQKQYDCGIIWDALSTPLKPQERHLIARLRDIDCQCLYIYTAVANASEMIALGFRHLTTEAGLSLFSFNIANYKRTPSWLNSRYWANPERWDIKPT